MRPLANRTCPVCQTKFDPVVAWQVCDTQRCKNVLGVRRFRARKRHGGDDGGGGKQGALGFPKPMLAKAKPPKPARVPAPRLFPDDSGGILATFGGAVEYGQSGSVSDKNRYSVKSDRKPSKTQADLVAA